MKNGIIHLGSYPTKLAHPRYTSKWWSDSFPVWSILADDLKGRLVRFDSSPELVAVTVDTLNKVSSWNYHILSNKCPLIVGDFLKWCKNHLWLHESLQQMHLVVFSESYSTGMTSCYRTHYSRIRTHYVLLDGIAGMLPPSLHHCEIHICLIHVSNLSCLGLN